MKKFDDSFRSETVRLIAGVDEAGRGPLAGPVVAAAVILPEEFDNRLINDSKKLTRNEREKCFQIIAENAIAYSYHFVNPEEIDSINILQATLKAMKTSVDKLGLRPDLILVDGNKIFYGETPISSIVKGDAKSISIAAASIVAKVVRDRFMEELALQFPIYRWEKNKGYPTEYHRNKIKEVGATPHHRKTFLKKIMFGQNGIFEKEER